MNNLISALVRQAGGTRHILTLGNGWSTAIDTSENYWTEHQAVIDELLRIVQEREEDSVILRTFTREISHTLPGGTQIPVKEVRGWYVNEGSFVPLSEQQMFAASCTDATTGEPIAPERAVRYTDAHPIEAAA